MNYLVTGITFCVFFIEAMLHFLIGHNSNNKNFEFKLPKLRDFARIITVLTFFSFLNGFVVSHFG
jgi:hypothetical protein